MEPREGSGQRLWKCESSRTPRLAWGPRSQELGRGPGVCLGRCGLLPGLEPSIFLGRCCVCPGAGGLRGRDYVKLSRETVGLLRGPAEG